MQIKVGDVYDSCNENNFIKKFMAGYNPTDEEKLLCFTSEKEFKKYFISKLKNTDYALLANQAFKMVWACYVKAENIKTIENRKKKLTVAVLKKKAPTQKTVHNKRK
jgi:hypothetical protein